MDRKTLEMACRLSASIEKYDEALGSVGCEMKLDRIDFKHQKGVCIPTRSVPVDLLSDEIRSAVRSIIADDLVTQKQRLEDELERL